MSEMDKQNPELQETESKPDLSQEEVSAETADKAEKKETSQQPGGNGAVETGEEFDFSALLPGTMEELLQLNILQFREWAYVYMGLIPHPKDKKVTKDIRQAKMAVDSASALFEIAMPHLNEKLQREFKVVISDLKMNFIAKANQ
jgi:hypothetical protein